MTTKEVSERNNKANGLIVFKTQEGHYYVESAEQKICYRVNADNGSKSCTCGDYTSRIEKDPSFQCKHILAVINGDGNIQNVGTLQNDKPKLDERWILEIEGREFVKYPGLLDLGHQKGISKIDVDPLQYPTKENGMFAICKALVVSTDGRTFTDVGDANPENCSSKVKKHVLRMASTRAIARALRSYTNIGMTCLEELGADDDESTRQRGRREATVRPVESDKRISPTGAPHDARRTEPEKKAEAKKEALKGPESASKASTAEAKSAGEKTGDKKAPDPPAAENTIKPSEAQITAIEKLAERRGINGEQLVKMFTNKYQKPYEQINATEAKGFIRHLQQAA